MLSIEKKEKIKKELLKKVGTLICPMCKNEDFTIGNGFVVNLEQIDFTTLALTGQAVPTIGFCCNNCGFISQHAIGILGLL